MGTRSSLCPFRTRQARLAAELALVWLLAAAGMPAQNVPAISQPLLLPGGLAYDAAGELDVAETGHHAIRRIDATGLLTTVAGTGVQGFAGDGGLATAALLDSPLAVAIDFKGDIYIADTHNQRIRRIDGVSGTIATVAGTGVAGFSGDGGPATRAALNLPGGLALDSAGNLYIADSRNHRIRRVDAATGTITTVAGDGRQGFRGDGGPATAASLDSPYGIAVDAAGNLYLGDSHNQRVRRVDSATQIITTVSGDGVAGFTGDGGLATASGLNLPRGLALDATGNLYIADLKNQRTRRVDGASGTIATVAGQGTQGFAGDGQTAVAALLDSPRAVTVSPGKLVTLSDTANRRVRQVDSGEIYTLGGISALTPTPDFSLAATGPATQTVAPGGTATFTFSVAQLPSEGVDLSSPVSLAATGLPLGATASFTPALVPSGSAPTTVTLKVSTPLSASVPAGGVGSYWVAVAPLLLLLRRRRRSLLRCFAGCAFAVTLGCGTRGYEATQTVSPRTYALSVTGTATGSTGAALVHTAAVTLMVQ